MSKVAFKTIVKKTVDKVSGAMKGHRVPKSQVKINQYIDSSQRKLTKIVMVLVFLAPPSTSSSLSFQYFFFFFTCYKGNNSVRRPVDSSLAYTWLGV